MSFSSEFKNNFRLSGAKPASIRDTIYIKEDCANPVRDTLKILSIAAILAIAGFLAARYTSQDKGLVAIAALTAFVTITCRKARIAPWLELIIAIALVFGIHKIAHHFEVPLDYKNGLASFCTWVAVMTLLNVEGVATWKKILCFFPMSHMAQLIVTMASAGQYGHVRIEQGFAFWFQIIIVPIILVTANSVCAQAAKKVCQATVAWAKNRQAMMKGF